MNLASYSPSKMEVKEGMNIKKEVRRLLSQDEETIEILNRVYGEGKWGLNTKEKRAAWRFGFEHPDALVGKFSHSDTPKERFHPIRLLHPKQLTDMDSFYVALGQCMSSERGGGDEPHISIPPQKMEVKEE